MTKSKTEIIQNSEIQKLLKFDKAQQVIFIFQAYGVSDLLGGIPGLYGLVGSCPIWSFIP